MVDFKDCTFFDIYIPNVFSPNEDGYNDFFDIHLPENLIVESFSIQIFDRWGNRVFSSLNINDSWDGKLNTETLSAGVYIYFIDLDYIDENGPGSEFISGDIGIVR
nr:gliding motility-associated C-terminal domain-containing protein [Portibacter lacus]